MLTENQLELLGDRIAGLYQELEQDVIADIARRIKNTGRYTETAELMAQAMYENGASPAQIRVEVMKILNADRAYQEEVAKNTLEWKKYIKSEIEEAKRIAEEEGNRIIADAGDMSFNADLAVWEQSGKKLTKDSSFTRLVREMSIVTAGTLKNLTRTMGFKGAHDFTSIRDLYIHSLDKALLKMAAGAFSYDQAVNDCIKELAKSGLRSVDYASGRSYQLDTAVRMCIRTACHQLSGKISMRNCETTGTDLVEVDAHWGARPDHAVWQGKVYSRSGKNKKYPPLSICRYGAADGLMGVNCRHRFYPFFEGISVPNKWEPEPGAKEYNGKKYSYYDATQRQRKMERDIRATKREIEAQKAVGGSTKELEAKKRRQIKEYHQFSNAMDISAKDNRLRVVAGSSNLRKTHTQDIINRSIGKSQKKFKESEAFRKGNTYRKKANGIEIIDNATYNKLIRNVIKNGGIVIRGTDEVEEHLKNNNCTAACIGDVLLFSKNATISDVLEETYHFYQNMKKMNINKPAHERLLLNEIDAQEYLISVADKYHIPEGERVVTRKNLASYRKELEKYYENHK